MRIDRFLSLCGCCSRSEAKKAIRNKDVLVNGIPIRTSDEKIDPNVDEVSYCGKKVIYREYSYIIMNKPAGVISATEDGRDKTVLDLLPDDVRNDRMFPCGRLDKNTLGLMLITDDGELAHELLSPKSHVDKKYRFCAERPLSEEEVRRFNNGLTLDDGYATLPAMIELDENRASGIITITEGKYHQIKRMFIALDNKITYLERVKFGSLELDASLKRGEWRYLSNDEVEALKAHKYQLKKQNTEK